MLHHFQTVHRLINHFKRGMIKEKSATINDMFLQVAAMHLHHNHGVRVSSDQGESSFSDVLSSTIEKKEINGILMELRELKSDEIEEILNLLHKLNDMEGILLGHLTGSISQEKVEEQIERDVLELMRRPILLYEYLGDLLGTSNALRSKILKEAQSLKEVSMGVERSLDADDKKDRFIESSLLLELMEKLQEMAEFKDMKEVIESTIPLRKMKKLLISHGTNDFPISATGLSLFQDALSLKIKLRAFIQSCMEEDHDYAYIEKRMVSLIQEAIVDLSGQDLVYFLQGVLEVSFSEVQRVMSLYGISSVSAFSTLTPEAISAINKDMIRYNVSIEDVRSFHKDLNQMKKDAIQEHFINAHGLQGTDHLLFALDYQSILELLSKHVYYSFLTRMLRPLGRLIESYDKIGADRALFSPILSHLLQPNAEQWVAIKLEELVIARIMKRQQELSLLFSTNDGLLINGFILARLLNISLHDAQRQLLRDTSTVYASIADLSLPPHLISPVSYCVALDIFKRLQERIRIKERERQERLHEREEKEQQATTQRVERSKERALEWIEKRITSALLSQAVNPTTLYWKDKDAATCTEHAAAYSRLSEDPIINLSQFFAFSIDKIKQFQPDAKVWSEDQILTLLQEAFSTVMKKRIGQEPSEEERTSMLDGERLEVAAMMSTKFRKLFDGAVYRKFKSR